MKIFFRLLIIFIAIIFFLLLGRNVLIKEALNFSIKRATGLKSRIVALDYDLKDSSLVMRNITLDNPSGFSDPFMFEVPEIFVDVDPKPLLRGKLVVENLRFELKDFYVIRKKDGGLNLDALKAIPAKDEKTTARPDKGDKGGIFSVEIRKARLKIGRVVFKDYARGTKEEPFVQTFNVNFDKEYKNISDIKSLVRLVVFQALTKTTIMNFVDINIQALKTAVGDVLGSTVGAILEEAVGQVKDLIPGP